jgi:hypothetical protein
MRAAGLLVLGLGIGLGAGCLAAEKWNSPALVWLAAGIVVAGLALLGVSRTGVAQARRRPGQPPD